jgi:hypothetical protein
VAWIVVQPQCGSIHCQRQTLWPHLGLEQLGPRMGSRKAGTGCEAIPSTPCGYPPHVRDCDEKQVPAHARCGQRFTVWYMPPRLRCTPDAHPRMHAPPSARQSNFHLSSERASTRSHRKRRRVVGRRVSVRGWGAAECLPRNRCFRTCLAYFDPYTVPRGCLRRSAVRWGSAYLVV